MLGIISDILGIVEMAHYFCPFGVKNLISTLEKISATIKHLIFEGVSDGAVLFTDTEGRIVIHH